MFKTTRRQKRNRRIRKQRRLLRGEMLERRNLLAAGFFSDSGQTLGTSDSIHVSLGDLDADGDVDAFVANVWEANKVWLNDGNGNFTDSGQQLGNFGSIGSQLGDLDGDGDLDAFVANAGFDPNKVWLNDGNGIFTDSGQSLGQSLSHSVDLGDLDNDGDLDAFVANSLFEETKGNRKKNSRHYNRVWLNDGSGNFSDSGQRLGDLRSYDVDLGDLDGDGDLDAFVANHGPDGNQGVDFHPDKVWLNDGTGNFTDSGQEIGLANDLFSVSQAAELSDLDGDCDLDAFVINGGFGDPANNAKPDLVWINDGDGNFSDSGQRLGAGRALGLAVGDLDGDGDTDVYVGNSALPGLPPSVAWFNDGTGNFSDSGQSIDPQHTWGPALGDLDGDGDIDAFLGNDEGANRVLLNGNPPAPTFAIDDVSVVEGDNGTTTATFTVTRSGDAGVVASVDYQTQDGGATSPDDYLAIALSNLSFGIGETSKTIDVTINGDTLDEGDHAFLVNLSNASSGASISDSEGVATIQDDDAPVALPMNVADLDATASQGSRGKWNATVTVTVVDASGNPISGVTVTGQWSSGTSGSATCTTDANGQCTVTKNNIKKNSQSVTFAVTGLVHASFTYDPNDNDDPDGDSDGTLIMILKP